MEHLKIFPRLGRTLLVITVFLIAFPPGVAKCQKQRYQKPQLEKVGEGNQKTPKVRNRLSGTLSSGDVRTFSGIRSVLHKGGDGIKYKTQRRDYTTTSKPTGAQFLTAQTAQLEERTQQDKANQTDINIRVYDMRKQKEINKFRQSTGVYLVNAVPGSTKYLEFESSTRDEISVVTQLLSNRYDTDVPADNCVGYFVNVEIRNSSEVNLTALTTPKDPPAVGEEDKNGSSTSTHGGEGENYELEGGWKFLWSVIATMLDTSSFCDLLPKVMLRVEPDPEPQSYVVLFQSHIGMGLGSQRRGKDCLLRVFVTRTPKERERRMQNTFALGVPLLILLLMAPMTFMHAHLLPDFMADIDVVFWLIYPAVAMRNGLACLFVYLYRVSREAYVARREERRQRQLEEQHRQIMEQGALVLADVTMNNVDKNNKGSSSNAKLSHQPLAHMSQTPQGTEEGFDGAEGGAHAEKHKKQEGWNANADQRNREGPSGAAVAQVEHAPLLSSRTALTAEDVVVMDDMVDMDLDGDDEAHGGLRRPLITGQKKVKKATGSVEGEFAGSTVGEGSAPATRSEEADGPNDAEPAAVVGQGKAVSTRSAVSGGAPAKSDCEEEDDERICRICRDDETDEKLISACECIGSVRWIHVSCLDRWRIESTKRNLHNVNCCEICKKPFHVPISRHAQIMRNLKSVSRGLLLVFSIIFTFITATIGQRVTLGEMTCRTPWHTVSYSTMFEIDGVVLTVFMQFTLTMLAVYAFALVSARFHADPETLEHLLTFQTFPPFWTMRNTGMIVLIFAGGVLQALALGLLTKLFIYRTSNIVWSWEASPCIGAVLFLGYVAMGTLVSVKVHSWAQRRRLRQARRVQVRNVEEQGDQQRQLP